MNVLKRGDRGPEDDARGEIFPTVFTFISAETARDRRSNTTDQALHLLPGRIRQMTTETVKWFNSTKGFGFIQTDNGGADAFVHISAVERTGLRDLQEGQKVSYELAADRKSSKMSAYNLKLVEKQGYGTTTKPRS